jgi:hypothetical protein
MRRSIIVSVTTADVMSRPSSPALVMTLASPSVAQQTPNAPAAICRRAIAMHFPALL